MGQKLDKMPKIINYKRGDQVGNVTYLAEGGKNIHGDRMCLFLCNCGNEFISKRQTVKDMNTKSCGCLRFKYSNKLKKDQVLGIKNMLWNENQKLRIIAKKYGVSIGTIWNIKVERFYKNI